MLATEWSLIEDGSTFDLTLQDHVTFHDGELFDADAVKANLQRALTLKESTLTGALAPVESIDVVDEMHARLKLSSPGAALPAVL